MSSKTQTSGRSGSTRRNSCMAARNTYGWSQKKATCPAATTPRTIWWIREDLPQPCLP